MLCYAIEHVIAAYDDDVHRQGITSYAIWFGLLYGAMPDRQYLIG